MKKHYFKYHPQFVPLILTGDKISTIRAERKNLPRVGETIVHETWIGKPYLSPVHRFATARLIKITHIRITPDRPLSYIQLNGQVLTQVEMQQVAREDGFPTLEDFLHYFQKPLTGHLYHWDNLQPLLPQQQPKKIRSVRSVQSVRQIPSVPSDL